MLEKKKLHNCGQMALNMYLFCIYYCIKKEWMPMHMQAAAAAAYAGVRHLWDWDLGQPMGGRPCDARAGTSVTAACTARATRVGLTPVC